MTLKTLLKEFCEPFGVKVKKSEIWEATEHKVFYPDNPDNYYAEGFMDIINRVYPEAKATEFTWSLLHELGHTQTWNYFTRKAWKRYEKTAPYIHDYEEYFRVPQERAATDWAANYIMNNPKKIKKFEKKLRKILGEIR